MLRVSRLNQRRGPDGGLIRDGAGEGVWRRGEPRDRVAVPSARRIRATAFGASRKGWQAEKPCDNGERLKPLERWMGGPCGGVRTMA